MKKEIRIQGKKVKKIVADAEKAFELAGFPDVNSFMAWAIRTKSLEILKKGK